MFLIICQVVLISLMAKETKSHPEMIEAYHEYPAGIDIVLCRFLCGIFLHTSLADELEQAFNFMKYSMNHPWKFHNWFAAFMVGFCQMMVLYLVETVNVALLLTNNTILEIIMNFLAIVIISEFDDYFFMSLRREPLKDLISNGEMETEDGDKIELSNILTIQTTSSGNARHKQIGNRLKKTDQKQPDLTQD